MEHILKPSDPCLDCERLGLTNKLRYFYINLEEQILKCESDSCLYPYTDDYGDYNNGAIDNKTALQVQISKPDMPIFVELQPFKEANASVPFIEEFQPMHVDACFTGTNFNLSPIKTEKVYKMPTASSMCKTAAEVNPAVNKIICMAKIKEEKPEKRKLSPTVTEVICLPSTSVAGISLASSIPDKQRITSFLAAVDAQNKKKPINDFLTAVDVSKTKMHAKQRIRHGSRILQNDKKGFVTIRPLDFVQQALAKKKTTG